RYRARLLLTGRRKPDGAALARLAQLGAEVLYVPADAAKPAMMARAAELARRRFGPLNGVLHLAGSVRDGLLRDFSPDDLTGLFDAKIDGTQVLDRVTRDDPLDCFVLFDSLAAVVGNASQTGYAFANAYLNDYARHRAALVAAGERRGRSLALACSDWQDGGMSLAPEILAQRRAEFGLEPLSTADGWRVLEYALTAGLTDAGVVRGRADGLARLFGAAIRAETSPEPKSTAPDAEAAYRRAERHLRGLLADAIGMAPERIDPQAPLEDYGFSSLLIVKLSDLLERDFGRVPKTLFFEHRTLAGLAGHFAQHHAAKLAELYPEPGGSGLQPATEATPPSVTNQSSSLPIPARPENHDQPIAIIGVSGRYPAAPDLAAFWDNLAAGRDCVTEIPPERWDWRQHFDPDQATPGKSYGRWGGFVADADKFDPLFFGITPHEAELMDPQERLFLQTAWHTVEDAGYGRRPLAGQDVGVFVGVMFGTYQLYGPEQFLRGNPVLPNSSYWSIANRVSYFFDFQGPSLAVDTACSSSLTAIHLAMEHLARGRCSMALAGGVNLSLHPYKYAGLSAGRFLSSDGRCRSFGAGGDGYVPGEGVGAVLLKPLDRALADGDHIYGVLRGSALNHGGKTNGYTVPNPDAQAALIKDALRRAEVTPESIGYVEAHGTGTALGDPIELAALAKAWGGRASPAVCPIGSVKSNIGHLESAAGIAALTKVLLQLRHRRLVPSLHCETLNPDIDFDHSPFRPVREAQGWDALPGQPRRAAISSFGAGGSNAHLILEEAPPLESVSTPTADRPELILLSARDATRLRELAQGLADWLAADDSAVSLADIAHTLRQRDGLRTRLAIVCRDRADLADKLAAYLAGRVDAAIIQGEAAITAPEAAAQAAAWLRAGDSTRVAQAWTQGAAMDWSLLHPGERRRRVPLPGYPFARNRLWLSISDNAIAPPAPAPVPAGLHPLLDRNVSGFGGIAFEKAVHPDAFYLHDHRVAGRPVLPGVAHLEMARAAGELAAGRPVAALSDVVWIRPVEAANGPVLLRVALAEQTGKTGFEIGSAAGSHAQGRLWFDAAEAAPARDVAAIRARCVRDIPVGPLYDGFKARGLDYGPAFRALRELRGGDNEALARLELPPEVRAGAEGFVLHPSLMDGALQAVAALMMDAAGTAPHVPFSLGRVEWHAPLPPVCHAHVVPASSSQPQTRRFDVVILDEAGRLCVSVKQFGVRLLAATPKPAAPPATPRPEVAATQPVLYAVPVWRKADLPEPTEAALQTAAPLLVLDQREDTYAKLLLQSKLTAWQRGDFLLVQPGERFEPNGDRRHRVRPDRPEDYAQLVEALRARRLMPGTVLVFGLTRDAGRPAERSLKELRALFLFTQALAKAKPERDIRLLYFGPTGLGTERPRLLAAAAGFGASVALEQRRLAFSAIDLPGDSAAEWVDSGRLVDVLKRELGAPASHGGAIRYQEGGRYRRGFEELAPPPAHGLPIRDGGTYLITGGLGGLGLICAEALAKRARVNLALAGRTAPGPAQMDALARIGARGGNVAHFAADIADWEATESLVRQVRERFGGLDGVLHAAGLIRDALLVNKAPGDFDAVLAPKILGAAHLDLATRGLPLDFFALFSSIAAMGGNLGQCDYAAGNAYLDALAAQREAQRQKGERHGRTVSIDWCLWEDGGMAVPEATRALMARATGLIALDRASGVDALARCLAADAPQVAVLAGGAGKLRRHFGL
ncbi:SDR family NAD(P)-dependent oxidoreductase, partial [Methylomagnum sp.]